LQKENGENFVFWYFEREFFKMVPLKYHSENQKLQKRELPKHIGWSDSVLMCSVDLLFRNSPADLLENKVKTCHIVLGHVFVDVEVFMDLTSLCFL
jgi:hypothetical protein